MVSECGTKFKAISKDLFWHERHVFLGGYIFALHIGPETLNHLFNFHFFLNLLPFSRSIALPGKNYQPQNRGETYLMYSDMFCRRSPYILNPCKEQFSWAVLETGTGLLDCQNPWLLVTTSASTQEARGALKSLLLPSICGPKISCANESGWRRLFKARPGGCKIAIPILFPSSHDQWPDFSARVMLSSMIKKARKSCPPTFRW